MRLIDSEELINKINARMVTTRDVTMVRKLINECYNYSLIQPKTVAEKLITATKTVNATLLHKAIYKSILGKECGETVDEDMFNDDDLREIADHLYAYLREEKPKANHYDFPAVIKGFPVLGHLVCDFWGSGCRTNEDAFCSYGEKE